MKPFYAGVSRDQITIFLKQITPHVLPQPNHTRHEWARWDAYARSDVSFVPELSFLDPGLWGFEMTDSDGYVFAFFRPRDEVAQPDSQV